MAAGARLKREHWLVPLDAQQDSADAISELKYTVDHLYHQGDLIHCFHIVPDSSSRHLTRKPDPHDEELAQKYFDDHLLPILSAKDVTFVYEVSREVDSPRKGKSIGEEIDLRAIVIDATATVVTRHVKTSMFGDRETSLGSVARYLVKNSSRPVIVMPQPPHGQM